jgi:hypothetical protein
MLITRRTVLRVFGWSVLFTGGILYGWGIFLAAVILFFIDIFGLSEADIDDKDHK